NTLTFTVDDEAGYHTIGLGETTGTAGAIVFEDLSVFWAVSGNSFSAATVTFDNASAYCLTTGCFGNETNEYFLRLGQLNVDVAQTIANPITLTNSSFVARTDDIVLTGDINTVEETF